MSYVSVRLCEKVCYVVRACNRCGIPEYNGLFRDVKTVFLCRLYRCDLEDNGI